MWFVNYISLKLEKKSQKKTGSEYLPLCDEIMVFILITELFLYDFCCEENISVKRRKEQIANGGFLKPVSASVCVCMCICMCIQLCLSISTYTVYLVGKVASFATMPREGLLCLSTNLALAKALRDLDLGLCKSYLTNTWNPLDFSLPSILCIAEECSFWPSYLSI